MSAVVSSVKTKLQHKLPGQIGTNRQWSDTYIESMILAATYAAWERIGMLWVSEEISLSDDTHEYDLDSKFIQVQTVEFATDGSNYDQHLKPASMQELDNISRRWRLDRGTRPERYVLLGAPGLQDPAGGLIGAKILIYRPLSTAGSSTLRVSGWGIGTASTGIPDDIQDKIIIPYVMAVLKAQHDVRFALKQYQKFIDGCDEIRGRFTQPYADGVRVPGMRLN